MSRLSKLAKRKPQSGPYIPKSNNYHLALAEYLHDALHSKGVRVSRFNDVCLRIASEDKSSNLVIDCLDGNMYINSRKIGTLRNFGGDKISDAYSCMRRSVNPIMEKMNTWLNAPLYTITLSDLRGKSMTSIVTATKDSRDNNEDDIVKIKDERNSKDSQTTLQKDFRNPDKDQVIYVEFPIVDMRPIQIARVIDARVERRNFITIAKKAIKDLFKNWW